MIDGIILVDKAAGWTSHDVVGRMRRIAGQKRIGHTGTLDPAATGLLVVCLGMATRVVEYMTGHDKRYEGVITLGVATATDDAEGTVLTTQAVPPRDAIDLRALEQQFTGNLAQIPPAFSAISVGGKRAYNVARAGGRLDLAARPVVIHDLALEWHDEAHLAIRVHCGSGTYIRSLARDIGAAIGCGGHLSALHRTHAGGFAIESARSVEELGTLSEDGRLQEAVLPLDAGIGDMNLAVLDDGDVARVRDGLRIEVTPERPAGLGDVMRLYTRDGWFLGIGTVREDGRVHAHKVIHPLS